jgi:hypothetical protein
MRRSDLPQAALEALVPAAEALELAIADRSMIARLPQKVG